MTVSVELSEACYIVCNMFNSEVLMFACQCRANSANSLTTDSNTQGWMAHC